MLFLSFTSTKVRHPSNTRLLLFLSTTSAIKFHTQNTPDKILMRNFISQESNTWNDISAYKCVQGVNASQNVELRGCSVFIIERGTINSINANDLSQGQSMMNPKCSSRNLSLEVFSSSHLKFLTFSRRLRMMTQTEIKCEKRCFVVLELRSWNSQILASDSVLKTSYETTNQENETTLMLLRVLSATLFVSAFLLTHMAIATKQRKHPKHCSFRNEKLFTYFTRRAFHLTFESRTARSSKLRRNIFLLYFSVVPEERISDLALFEANRQFLSIKNLHQCWGLAENDQKISEKIGNRPQLVRKREKWKINLNLGCQ